MKLDMRTRLRGALAKLTVPASALLLTLAIAPGLASAHAELASSTPANDATVARAPAQVSMTFSEEISVDQSTAELDDASGTAIAGAAGTVDRADRTKMNIQTPGLKPGKYTVKWKSVTVDDNGITNGTFSFTVAGDSAQQTAVATPTETASGGTNGTGGTGSNAALPATGAGDNQGSNLLWGVSALAVLVGGLLLRRGTVRR